MKNRIVCLLAITISVMANAQFEPRAGEEGSTAIHQDSPSFKEWAKSCTVFRGYANISDSTKGLAAVGDETSAVGKSGQNGILSLGDGGSAVLEFESPLFNGEGFDFAVFENGFPIQGSALDFLEYAFVEVSSDGVHFFRFPSEYAGEVVTQVDNNGTDTRLYHNLAGKYVAPYGVPFDLDELKDVVGLDVNHITHVKIEDVVGTINPRYARKDSKGKIINEPWPTPFGSSGFDLDAIGAIHVGTPTGTSSMALPFGTKVYPNPATDVLHVATTLENVQAEIQDLSGKTHVHQEFSLDTKLNTSSLSPGIYLLSLSSNGTTFTQKVIIQ